MYLVGSNIVAVFVSAAPTATVAERMLTPGALTSGLIWPSPCTGPRELKSAIAGPKTVAELMRAFLVETPDASVSDFRNRPLFSDTPSVGMADLRTVAADSSASGFLVSLLNINAATAPAAAAVSAFEVYKPV